MKILMLSKACIVGAYQKKLEEIAAIDGVDLTVVVPPSWDDPRSPTRLEKLYTLMQGEIEILQVEKKIRARVKKQMEKTQKEYYLNEQMRAIQKELGDKDDLRNEIQELEEKLAAKDMPDEARDKVEREMIELGKEVRDECRFFVQRALLDYLIVDEEKHDKILGDLEKFKKNLYPYA